MTTNTNEYTNEHATGQVPGSMAAEADALQVATEREHTDRQRIHLAAMYEQLSDRIKAATSERDAVAAELRALGPGPGGLRPDGSERVVTVAAVPKFSATQARLVLPPDLLELITESVVSSTLARKALPPAAYDACRVVDPAAKPTVNVR